MTELRILKDVLTPNDEWYVCDVVIGPFDKMTEAIGARKQLLEAFDDLLADLRKRLDEPEGSS